MWRGTSQRSKVGNVNNQPALQAERLPIVALFSSWWPGLESEGSEATMRKIWLNRDDFEMFHQDISPLDYEFFRTHVETFKRMWLEQV